MILNVWLNGKKISEEISADTLLIDFVRKHGCSSVKRGCDTSNCGLCTLFVEDKPVLSCSMLAARVDGKHITTLEGLQEEAREFGAFIAQKRLEKDVKLRPIAEKLGVSVTYLSDIIKGRRNPPDIDGLEALAKVLNLSEGEREEMLDLAGRERKQVSPDLREYIMDEALPNARVALRRAKSQGLGDDFWQEVNQIIDKRNGGE